MLLVNCLSVYWNLKTRWGRDCCDIHTPLTSSLPRARSGCRAQTFKLLDTPPVRKPVLKQSSSFDVPRHQPTVSFLMCQVLVCSLFYKLLLKIEAPGHWETAQFSPTESEAMSTPQQSFPVLSAQLFSRSGIFFSFWSHRFCCHPKSGQWRKQDFNHTFMVKTESHTSLPQTWG